MYAYHRARTDSTTTRAPPDAIRSDGAPAPRAWKALPADVAKRDAVVAAMRHAWSAYEQARRGAAQLRARVPLCARAHALLCAVSQHAWGHDELDPLARAGKGAPPRRRRTLLLHALTRRHFGCG